MSTCYKDFSVVIEYSNGTSGVIHGATVSIDEGIELQTMESLGAKGESSVFNSSITQGSLTVDGLLTESGVFARDEYGSLQLQGSNDQNIQIKAGPYTLPKPCIMDSTSMNISVGSPVSFSQSFSFFGPISGGGTQEMGKDGTIGAVIPSNVSMSGYENIGGENVISNVSWGLSQDYETVNLLADPIPYVIFKGGQKTLSIDGYGLTMPLAAPESGQVCVIPPKDYALSLSGCDWSGVQNFPITSGYMTQRSLSIQAGGEQETSVLIIEYL